MAGLFDYEDPYGVGNTAFAAGLLNAGGPSRMPISGGQGIAQALMARQQAASEAGQNQRRNALVQAQIQQQMMLMAELKRQQAEQEQARQAMRQHYMTPQSQAASMPGGPTNANAAMIPQMPGGFNVDAFRNAMLAEGNLYGVDLAPKLAKPTAPPLILKKGERGFDPRTNKPIEGLSNVEEEGQWDILPMRSSGGQLLQQHRITKEIKAVGSGPLVNVNTGNLGNENKFLTKLQELQAQQFSEAQASATEAQQGNNALTRIEGIISQGGVTGGPLATPVVTARNIASQLGMPIDKVLDKNNSMYTAEASARIAEKIIKGGRALTDSDVARLREAFPGYGSGIPTSQLPAFIAQLKAINNERISNFTELRKQVPQEYLNKMPITFTDTPRSAASAAQPNPPPSVDIAEPKVIDFSALPKAGR